MRRREEGRSPRHELLKIKSPVDPASLPVARSVPGRLEPHRDIGFLHKPEYFCVEAERFALLVDHNACQL